LTAKEKFCREGQGEIRATAFKGRSPRGEGREKWQDFEKKEESYTLCEASVKTTSERNELFIQEWSKGFKNGVKEGAIQTLRRLKGLGCKLKRKGRQLRCLLYCEERGGGKTIIQNQQNPAEKKKDQFRCKRRTLTWWYCL